MNEHYGTTFNVQEQDYYKELVEDITKDTVLTATSKEALLGWLANIRSASKQRIRKAVTWELVFYSRLHDAEVSLVFDKLGDIHSQRLFNQRLWDATNGFKLPKMAAGQWDTILRFLGRLFGDNEVTVETEAEWLDGIFHAWATGPFAPSLRWCRDNAEVLYDTLDGATTIAQTHVGGIGGQISCIEYKGRYHILLSNWVRELQKVTIQFTETELKSALHNTGWESRFQLAARGTSGTANDKFLKKWVWRSPLGFELPAMPGERPAQKVGNNRHIQLVEG